MSTPNPLIPQGTFHAQASKGASNVRIAVATIVAIHVVFFGGLLLQGCKRDTSTASLAETNSPAATNFSLPPIETSSYYTSSAALPADSSNRMLGNANANPATPDYSAQSNAPAVRDTLAPSAFNNGITPAPAPENNAAAEAKEYTIQRGDTFAKIAIANGTTVNAIRKANSALDPTRLRPGMKIQVPVGTSASTAASPAPGGSENAESPAASGASGATYTVKQGDNLTRIARAHHVTIAQLRAANGLKTSNVRAGQKLKIPAGSAKKASTNSNGL
jgi:LysM repeat protein